MITPTPNFQGLNVSFHVTESCNLACTYCYEWRKQNRDLPLDYAKKFIDLLLTDNEALAIIDRNDIGKTGLIMDFIGGDALMRPKLCDAIIEYFVFQSTIQRHPWSHGFRCSISTNATLFGRPDVREFLMKYKGVMSLGVSMDGSPEIHDRNRIFVDGRGSMSAIMKWWPWYLEYAGESASTKSTLNRASIPYIADSLKFLHEDLGLQQINMNFIFEDMGLEAQDLEAIETQLEKALVYVLDHRHDLYWGMFDYNRFYNSDIMRDPDQTWCGSGCMPTITPNGRIYPCFRFVPISQTQATEDMHIGDIWEGFNRLETTKVVQNCTRSKISPEKCFECPVESSCSWCIAGAYQESGRFYRQDNLCEVHPIQVKWARKYWDEYRRLEGIPLDVDPTRPH